MILVILNSVHSSSLASAPSAYFKQGIERFEKNQATVNQASVKADNSQRIASPNDIKAFQEQSQLTKIDFSANTDNIKTARALMTYATTMNESKPIGEGYSLVDIYV